MARAGFAGVSRDGGTRDWRRATIPHVRCDAVREAVSATLDGEDPGVDRALLDSHLRGCPGCRRWREGAHSLTRRTRLWEAWPRRPAPPHLCERIAREEAARVRLSPRLIRAGLVVVATGQVILAVPSLLFGSDHNAPIHVAHEMGAFDMALAVGLYLAAWQPRLAAGMRGLVGCVALLLALTAVVDLVSGQTTVGDELPHLLAVAGWLLLREASRAEDPFAPLDARLSLRTLLGDARARPALAEGSVELGRRAPVGSGEVGAQAPPERRRAAGG